jgi:hypothetical protein
MKNIWKLLIILTLLLSIIIIGNYKIKNDWRYEIHGYVIKDGKPHPAIWKTDTIEFDKEHLFYQNSDGTKVVIPTPYVLIDYKNDKVIKDTNTLLN